MAVMMAAIGDAFASHHFKGEKERMKMKKNLLNIQKSDVLSRVEKRKEIAACLHSLKFSLKVILYFFKTKLGSSPATLKNKQKQALGLD